LANLDAESLKRLENLRDRRVDIAIGSSTLQSSSGEGEWRVRPVVGSII